MKIGTWLRIVPLVAAMLIGQVAVAADDKWPGIDEAVVNRIAREHGREARKSWIDTGEGDLQLFVFLLAGAVGGFGAGYCWRMLTEGKKRGADDPPTG